MTMILELTDEEVCLIEDALLTLRTLVIARNITKDIQHLDPSYTKQLEELDKLYTKMTTAKVTK
jgi:hypothetical protein